MKELLEITNIWKAIYYTQYFRATLSCLIQAELHNIVGQTEKKHIYAQ